MSSPDRPDFDSVKLAKLFDKPAVEPNRLVIPLNHCHGWELQRLSVVRPGGNFNFRLPSLRQALLHSDWCGGLAILVSRQDDAGELRHFGASITPDTSVFLRYKDPANGKHVGIIFKR